MKLKPAIALAAVVVAVLFLVGWTSRAAQSSQTDWEYKTLTVWHAEAVNPNVTQLNNLGEEGWELVTVLPVDIQRGETHQTKVNCYFKRRR